jgi:hypothetical protein
MPVSQFETGQQLVKRFRAVQETKEEFWDSWVKEIFPSFLRQRKSYKYKRDTKIGDVVLRKDETATGQTYKYARIVNVHVGLDRKVRSVDVEYKIPGETKFCVTTRLIHKLVLVVPVEEQTMEEPEMQVEAVEEGRDPPERQQTLGAEKDPGKGEVVEKEVPSPTDPEKERERDKRRGKYQEGWKGTCRKGKGRRKKKP